VAEAAGLHVAVLSIGEAGATPDDALVVDRLRAAGHSIIGRASVDNFVPVVRRQLAAWVADADIDIVVAVGGGDDNVASSALAPLVTQQLPGFADVFRMLVFQTLGSAAVLVNAEAARCATKVVFLLPAMADGVRLALDKLIVPQLDARTEPYNVARLMPRRPTTDKPTPTNDKPTAGKPATTDPPPSSTAPPRTASARTTPPPFRRTPPAGVTSTDPAKPAAEPAKPADAAKPAAAPVKPAEVAKAATDKPKADDSGKMVVDIESIGGVADPEESGKLREARPEPGTPVPIGKSKKSIDADRTERIFVLRARESQPRMGMFGAPRTQIHPVAKALALLALLALTSTGAIVVWSRIGLGTRRVSASNPTPSDPPQPQPQPQPQPLPAVAPPAVEPPPGSAASSEIDVDPPASQPAPPQPEPPATPPATPAQPPHPPRPHVAATPPVAPAAPVPPTPPAGRPPVQPVQPVASSGDGCDEVACVLDQYARPCCEVYRPKAPSERPGAPDQLDRTSIRESIDTMKPVVIACGERFKVKGQVRIALVVAPDGHVTSSTVASSPDEGLGACVAEALRRVQFKQTSNGTHFTYPYQF
jgi:molybdenum cofactor biosynthesis protein B